MTEIAERYARASDAFDATLRGIETDGWDAQTPCAQWTARQLVEHVTSSTSTFLGLDGEAAPEPSATDDPAEAWRACDIAVREILAEPSQANKEIDGFFGRLTIAEVVDRFMSFDLVVHRWDLARATGQDERIPDEEIDRIRQIATGFGAGLRSERTFGPELEVPADADRQTKLLAFLGRQA